MAIFVCENPECGNFRRDAKQAYCERCGHKFISKCRKCGAAITSSIQRQCWACGAPYKLSAPLPPELLQRHS